MFAVGELFDIHPTKEYADFLRDLWAMLEEMDPKKFSVIDDETWY